MRRWDWQKLDSDCHSLSSTAFLMTEHNKELLQEETEETERINLCVRPLVHFLRYVLYN